MSIALPPIDLTEYRSGANSSHSTMPTGMSIFGSVISMSPFLLKGVPAWRYTNDT